MASQDRLLFSRGIRFNSRFRLVHHRRINYFALLSGTALDFRAVARFPKLLW